MSLSTNFMTNKEKGLLFCVFSEYDTVYLHLSVGSMKVLIQQFVVKAAFKLLNNQFTLVKNIFISSY